MKIKSPLLILSLLLLFACRQGDARKKTLNQSSRHFQLVRSVSPDPMAAFNRFHIFQDRIYASDQQNTIYIFDMQGHLLNRFGGKGEGPGEFRYLEDFTFLEDRLIAADSSKKIVRFDLNGQLIDEIPTKKRIHGVLILGGELCYIARTLVPRVKGKLRDFYFQVYRLSDQKELFSVVDDTVQFEKGSSVHAPFLVAPFPNRKFFLFTSEGLCCIFQSRVNSFFYWSEDHFEQKKFSFTLQADPVKDRDKREFFKQMRSANSAQIAERMKKSIVFPAGKELFMGAIPWGNDIALLRLKDIIILSAEGDLLESLSYPSEMDIDDYWDFFYPEHRLQFYDNHVYFMNVDEDKLQVFRIIP